MKKIKMMRIHNKINNLNKQSQLKKNKNNQMKKKNWQKLQNIKKKMQKKGWLIMKIIFLEKDILVNNE